MHFIFCVSDASGETAESIVRAALTQFSSAEVKIVRRPQITTTGSVASVVREAAAEGALIVYTLVSHSLRHFMLEQCRLLGVHALDLMGPVLDRLTTLLQLVPTEQPGLLDQLQKARAREIEAVDFAFRHDDGQHPEDLGSADIILVGVSRTMKTPATLYLAYRGWLAGNVPIVAGMPLPPHLPDLPADRIFLLDIAASRLQERRQARARLHNLPEDPYASLEHIQRELLLAREICRQYGWHRVDTTGKSVEEVTREIIVVKSLKSSQS